MNPEIKLINLGGVNCYLVKTGAGFVLIDTGFSFRRGALKKELEKQGCRPGNLDLVIITHGDSDHTGNCVYLREKYGVKIAVHRSESPAIEKGNILLNRQKKQGLFTRVLLSFLASVMAVRFKPDLFLEDGDRLSEYSFEAKVIHIPGHTTGSIAVLTDNGALFSGDLLSNRKKPEINSLIDNPAEARASAEKLKKLKITTVYPGHGNPFPMEKLVLS
jgi:hydroxyacylglutathione hydrolase